MAAFTIRGYEFGAGTVGWLIALVVLILCAVLWFIGKQLTGPEVLGLIALLAASRLF